MAIPIQNLTAETFLAYTQQPTNLDKRLELLDGVLYEVTSNSQSAKCAALIASFISPWVRIHKLGFTTGADGGYTFNGHYIVPDLAFVSIARQKQIPNVVYNPIVPDFALEVISPSDLDHPTERIQKKIEKYQQAKIRLLWVVYPTRQEVEIYELGQPTHTLGIQDTLDGGTVFVGLTIPVNEIF